MAESFSFWLVAIGIPLIVVSGNSTIRFFVGLPQSAPADIILALVVFDFAIIAQPNEFKNYIHFETFRILINQIFALMIILGMMS